MAVRTPITPAASIGFFPAAFVIDMPSGASHARIVFRMQFAVEVLKSSTSSLRALRCGGVDPSAKRQLGDRHWLRHIQDGCAIKRAIWKKERFYGKAGRRCEINPSHGEYAGDALMRRGLRGQNVSSPAGLSPTDDFSGFTVQAQLESLKDCTPMIALQDDDYETLGNFCCVCFALLPRRIFSGRCRASRRRRASRRTRAENRRPNKRSLRGDKIAGDLIESRNRTSGHAVAAASVFGLTAAAK